MNKSEDFRNSLFANLKWFLNKLTQFFLCICFTFSMASFAYGSSRPTVNILTWWGYLDSPEVVNSIEKDCNVNISYDEYYSNSEFMSRKNLVNYDILIFSNPIYNVIKDDIKMNHSDLWKESASYNPVIKKHYLESHFPPNVVYFMHALTGFLWNPDVINIVENDSVFDIFKKAGSNIVVMMDDPLEEAKLLNLNFHQNQQNSPNELNEKNFRALTQNAKVYITNNYNQISQKPNFAFAFTWSGEALMNMKTNNKKLNFFIHPKFSYTTSDLLAQLNDSQAAACVAKELTSKKMMVILQNNQYYFSSYGDYSKSADPEYIELYKSYLKNLGKISWNNVAPTKDFQYINREWKLIKIKNN